MKKVVTTTRVRRASNAAKPINVAEIGRTNIFQVTLSLTAAQLRRAMRPAKNPHGGRKPYVGQLAFVLVP